MSQNLATDNNFFSTSAASTGAPIRWLRTTRRRPCPVCGRQGWCEVSDDNQLVHCMRTPSDQPMRWRGGGWLHRLGLPLNTVTIADLRAGQSQNQSQPAEPLEPLAPVQIDEINRAFLALCQLGEQHRQYLQTEGVPAEGCGSLSYSQAVRVARQLVTRFGEEIAHRHPLLREVTGRDGRSWWTIAGAADGILFPAKNHRELILGIQIRKDQPRGNNDRYRWLSHDSLGGTPLTLFRAAAEAEAASRQHLLITEGYKKAAIGSRHWQCQAISLAGVTAYRDSELIEVIGSLGVTSVSLAFDQDKRQNRNVQQAEQRLLRLVAAAFPHIEIYYLNWNGDQGKGLDDALRAGADFTFERALPAEGTPRFVNDLPAEVLGQLFGRATPLYTLQEARQLHRDFFNELLLNIDGRQTVITSPTGTGKSSAADDALAQAVLDGRLRGRWLLLAPNKANITERTRPGTLLGQAVAAGLVAVQRGRNPFDLTDTTVPHVGQAEDCANPLAQQAGAARQITAQVICKTCPFGSDRNWQEFAHEVGFDPIHNPERPWRCEVEGYLASQRRSRQASVVVATKETYLNESKLIEDFEGVICDEELLPHLIEIINITSGVLSGWREKIALKNLHFPDWIKLFSILERAFDNLAQGQSGQAGARTAAGSSDDSTNLPLAPGRLLECLPTLEQAAQELGYDLYNVLAQCGTAPTAEESVYEFERHYRHNNRLVLPFRSGLELLDALTDPVNPARFARNTLDGSYYLVLHRPRHSLVERLREKTLVILDATVPPALRLLLPDLEELHYRVNQHLEITQVTSGLYSKQNLYNPVTRQRLSRAIRAFAGSEATTTTTNNNHLTILPMRFQNGSEALETPQNSRVDHWGLHRATSRYSDCDSLALVGHHLRPIDYIKAEVIAAKAFAQELELPPDNTTATNRLIPGERELQKLRVYNHRLDMGRVAGRWMKADPDEDIQAAIEQEYVANILQAIGRLRAALRSDELPPARVLLLCNEPVGDMEVAHLLSLDELLRRYEAAEVVTNTPATTDPAEPADSNNINHVNSAQTTGLVIYPTFEESRRDPWDEALIQDETSQTQSFDPMEWPPEPPQIE